MPDASFWQGKRVFLTGHTGFKGSWLSLWLNLMGADVMGYALEPPTTPSMFNLCQLGSTIQSIMADVRDQRAIYEAIIDHKPQIIIHMAAQALVRESYKSPVETYATNIMGTVNLLEAARTCSSLKAIVNVTTDKCYDNKEWVWGYRENEAMGGYDPYSSSKACSELVTASYRNSFFNPENYSQHQVAIASARAGNVIGGGDWANDRLLPDCFRAILNGEPVHIRSPFAIRPWQHVLEPLGGYLILAQRLFEKGTAYAEAWNFGPDDRDAQPVENIINKICALWGSEASYTVDKGVHPHEAQYLKLDCSKAKTRLNWQPRWGIEEALAKTVEWMKAYQNGADLTAVCLKQIKEYSSVNKHY